MSFINSKHVWATMALCVSDSASNMTKMCKSLLTDIIVLVQLCSVHIITCHCD